MEHIWSFGGTLLKRALSSPLVNSIRGKKVRVAITKKREIRLHPSRIVPKRLSKKRNAPGIGIYAGQISNFDTTELDHFFVRVPNVRLTPEGTDYKPTKLFAVWRTSRILGIPYWLKDILENKLGLTAETQYTHPVIVRNSPAVNQMLWHVKHLIRLKPITFPDGFPTEKDIGSTFLNYNGELRIRKEYRYAPEKLVITEEEKKMDPRTLKKLLIKRWYDAYST
ncbi:39S ribosomal protein L30, mitochondrial [Chamberlinius hualienensis]